MRILLLLVLYYSCFSYSSYSQVNVQSYQSITTGAQQTEIYLPLLKNKRVAIVTNASGIIGNKHLVDTLLKHKIKIVKIFGPEHGFRGTSDAGEKVKSSKDPVTNIAIVSLYGSHKKPTKDDFKGVDIVLYDIQDVGVRFYTYISTMTYVMEACAENSKPLIILDRPNPNGFYIDGPVMTNQYKSFLGLHSIPIVYGMTSGEYAQMVNNEGWLKGSVKCELSVITLKNYDRKKFVSGLPVKPSPNLPNDTAILFYPSVGLFEGTVVSVGRGTEFPFQIIGSPSSTNFKFSFKPSSNAISKKPKYQDTLCYGVDLKPLFDNQLQKRELNISLLALLYEQTPSKQTVFFDNNFNYHAGNEVLKNQIISNVSQAEIRLSWKAQIDEFKVIRKKYLLYADF